MTEATPERLVATMPVAGNTQPYGLLHGGARVVLAETLGSIGAASCTPGPDGSAVGLDINATHHRAARAGVVTGTATAAQRRPHARQLRRRRHRRATAGGSAPRGSPACCATRARRLTLGRPRSGSAGDLRAGRGARAPEPAGRARRCEHGRATPAGACSPASLRWSVGGRRDPAHRLGGEAETGEEAVGLAVTCGNRAREVLAALTVGVAARRREQRAPDALAAVVRVHEEHVDRHARRVDEQAAASSPRARGSRRAVRRRTR